MGKYSNWRVKKIGGQGTWVTDNQSVLIIWVPQLEKAGLGFLGDRP